MVSFILYFGFILSVAAATFDIGIAILCIKLGMWADAAILGVFGVICIFNAWLFHNTIKQRAQKNENSLLDEET